MRIGIDLMGSDRSHLELFKALLQAISSYGSSFSLTAFATPQAIQEIETEFGKTSVRFQKSDEVIYMTDDPIGSVRQKKNASLLLGLRFLKKKKIDAFITAGNTGALVAAATLYSPKLPGIKRPALMASLPSNKGFLSLIDVGGNVNMKAPLLYQYALIGAEYQRKFYKKTDPKIALLNIGVEDRKGSKELQEAFKLLSTIPGFVGNIEARDVFKGDIDVLVTDGFTGNVLLKTAEGVANFIFDTLKNDASPALKQELADKAQRFSWEESPGAMLVGVEGTIIKCHGSSGKDALLSSIVFILDCF